MASGPNDDRLILHPTKAGQHIIQCANCPKEELIGAKFYCYDCKKDLCTKCQESHPQRHNISTYGGGIGDLKLNLKPCEKCQKEASVFCNDCNVSLCKVCVTHLQSEHTSHNLVDKDELTEKRQQCIDKVTNIRHNILHHCQNLKTDVKNDIIHGKKQIDEMRDIVNTNAERLKDLVENVRKESLNKLQLLETSMTQTLEHQRNVIDTHTGSLHQTVCEFEDLDCCISPESINHFYKGCVSKISKIPDLVKVRLPSLESVSDLNTECIEKSVGKITNIEPFLGESREISQKHKLYFRSETEATLVQKLCANTKLLRSCRHISLTDYGEFWANDYDGNLMLADLNGNVTTHIVTKDKCSGFHTVTANGHLLCTDEVKKEIFRIPRYGDYKIRGKETLIANPTWNPISIYCCKHSGDILVGSFKDKNLGASVTRFNMFVAQTQQIFSSDYKYPHYITENHNGDICVSDSKTCGVIVHNRLGEHRFTYTRRGSNQKLFPSGICCDILRNILVYDGNSKAILILDSDGRFLSTFISLKSEWTGLISHTRGLAIDNDYNLWIGGSHSNTIQIFSYLKRIQDTSV
ncbi:uncharacterized protein LOC130055166 [Ostrea edulis]|uniref:uncharacterized protein LOC130055166 n=1 Tax=Ostrea edulis TaxID=37623 RepID=UPI0024AF2B7E|nr:uncharacterized protein LOC130055166 [Ostrea edulis]